MKKRIKIPLYHGTVTILQVDKLQSIEKQYNLVSLHGMDACCFRNHKENGYSRYVLAFETNGCNSRHIAHESLHFVAMLFKDRGIDFDLINDEPQCYLLGWMVGECHKYLKVDDSEL